MIHRNFRPEEVAAWLTGSPDLMAAVTEWVAWVSPQPTRTCLDCALFAMVTRKRDGRLTATLEDIATALAWLGPLPEEMLARRVLQDASAEPSQRTRRGRARRVPDTIVLRRLVRALAFWREVVAVAG